MKQDRKQEAKALQRAIGRQDWGGIKPVTKVVPDKKKESTTRKRKHKGRKFDPYYVLGRPLPLDEVREHLEKLAYRRLQAEGLLQVVHTEKSKTTFMPLEKQKN